MNFLVDENMPRSLAPQIAALGFTVQDVRDVGLRGHPDTEVMETAIATDSIIITRDRGLADPRGWAEAFTAGVIFINLPDDTPASNVNTKILELLANRLPVSLLGALTTIESRRALSRPISSINEPAICLSWQVIMKESNLKLLQMGR